MITLHELDTAIAKCQGLPDPKPEDAIKLAAFYTVKNEMYGKKESAPAYSYSAPPVTVEKSIDYYGDTDFARAIDGKPQGQIWPIIDELMTVLQATNPRLYAGVMRKIED